MYKGNVWQPFFSSDLLKFSAFSNNKKTQVSVRQLISHIWTFGKGLRRTGTIIYTQKGTLHKSPKIAKKKKLTMVGPFFRYIVIEIVGGAF